MSNLQMYDSLLHWQDSAKKVRYPRASNIFIYFFNNRYQNWILKIGGRVVQ